MGIEDRESDPEADPDGDLVRRAQAELPRRTGAYNALVRRHSGPVFRRAYGILRSESDAEDATQEVFLAVYRNLPKFRPERPFKHWLSTITLNACRMQLRKRSQEQRRRDAYEAEPRDHRVDPQGDPAMRRLVLGLLDELDPGTRIPIVLRFVEGYTHAEIARELDLGESAVRMRVSRGAKKLRQLYEARLADSASDPEDGGGGHA